MRKNIAQLNVWLTAQRSPRIEDGAESPVEYQRKGLCCLMSKYNVKVSCYNLQPSVKSFKGETGRAYTQHLLLAKNFRRGGRNCVHHISA